MTNEIENKIKKLKELGGREWKTDKHHRVYFNNIAEKLNIDLAAMNFKKRNNIEDKTTAIKFYYDATDNKFYHENCYRIENLMGMTEAEIGGKLIADIEAQIAKPENKIEAEEEKVGVVKGGKVWETTADIKTKWENIEQAQRTEDAGAYEDIY